MPRGSLAGYVTAIRAESDRLAALLDGADLEAPVPSCPEWVLRDLVLHLGDVQRFWAANVRAADVGGPCTIDVPDPSGDDDFAGWMAESTGLLAAALDKAGGDDPCWTWWGEPATAGAVGRHQVQEAAVHRWDAEATVGEPRPLGPDVADDGVDEFFAVMLSSAGPDDGAGSGNTRSGNTGSGNTGSGNTGSGDTGSGTIVFGATDSGRAWWVGGGT
ncbi:MAG: maleylpyruvate isomerase N-terminal domain-containing protein, partial [Acidimicrobiales bacterium]